jgi:Ca-activated chloride channel homolog
MSTDKYPWPQHQLTAFVLGELKPEVAERIQATADKDPALAAEIIEIRAMVDQLSQLYKHETVGIVPTTLGLLPDAQAAEKVAVSTRTPGGKLNRTAAAGLLAMAACLLIAFTLAAPALKNYFAVSEDPLAQAEVSAHSTAAEQNIELEKQLQQANAALTQEQAVRRSSVSQTSPPQSSGSASSSGQIELFGDVQVETIDEVDLLPVRDSQADAASPQGANMGGATAQESGLTVADGEPQSGAGVLSYATATDSLQAVLAERVQNKSEASVDSNAVPGEAMSDEQLAKTQERRAQFFRNMQASGGMMGGMPAGGEMGDMGGGMGMGGMGMGGMGTSGAGIGSGPDAPVEGRDSGMAGVELDVANVSRAKGRARFGTDRQPLGESADKYAPIYENQFTAVGEQPLSTFSIDVDTASYVKARQFLLQSRRLPPPNSVRAEEFINYFEYEYAGPSNDDPFGADLAVTDCPWRPDHRLVRIALQAKKIDVKDRPKANIVFLLDVSGSMDEPNKLPLVKESMRMLIEQLGENDRVAMVVYAGAAGCVLESTTGDKQELILGALDRLNAGGSTNGGQGIQLAYDLARDHFVPGGINRVILCTDGDFNVGVTSTEALVDLVAENAKSKIFLTVLGFGMGNSNDAMMEQISNKGNGVYGFVDSRREAQRQMVKQLAGNIMTVAKDVKIQVEFNPVHVASYRLIGYENRVMAAEDFNNDKKDAGEIGAGHRVTALYEIEPVAVAPKQPALPPTDELRYQKKQQVATEPPAVAENDETSGELLAVKLRYKQPEGDKY